MVTNEERREVAARLRRLSGHREVDKEFVHEALGLYMGECVDGYDPVSVSELADLIEPEPERTCHIKISDCTDSLGQKMYRCSECGSLTTDDACFFEGEPDIDGFSYCPSCGAKVVDE